MPSLSAFDKLDVDTRKGIIDRVIFRKKRYTTEMVGFYPVPNLNMVGKILLVGDQPAPDRPDDPAYHFTPFGALWHSSLYINKSLHDAEIDENWLFWENAYDFKGIARSHHILTENWGLIVALGGNAATWIKQRSVTPFVKVQHPAAWKRFHSKEPYPLIEILQQFIDGRTLLPELPHHGYRL